MWASLTVPNFNCLEFFWLRPTASLTVWKNLKWMSWSWAIQVLAGLSYHVKASGNQKVIFDPKDPRIPVALKALGTLEDRQSKTEMIKKKKIRRDCSWMPGWYIPVAVPTKMLLALMWRTRLDLRLQPLQRLCLCVLLRDRSSVFSVSRQRSHAGSDGWSFNIPAIRAWIQQWALKWESAAR